VKDGWSAINHLCPILIERVYMPRGSLHSIHQEDLNAELIIYGIKKMCEYVREREQKKIKRSVMEVAQCSNAITGEEVM
jgi:hypothetical protein